MTPQQHRVQTNGVTLNVNASGPEDGPLVILLHGFPDFSWGWRHHAERLAQQGFRVLAPDQRGYASSDKPSGIAAYRFEELGRDIVGLIDWAGRDKASIVGHDWGAAVAWWMGLAHPERMERMVAINVPHPVVFQKHLLLNPAQLAKSWYILMFQLPALPEWAFTRNDGEAMVNALRKSSRPGTFPDEDIEAYRAAWRQPGAPRAMVNWYRAGLQRKPRTPSDPRIRVPTMLIWGTQDVVLGAEMAQPSVDLCDDGRLELFEDAGHWVHFEEPDRVSALLQDFLTDGHG